jgi:asparagine synthase (glutamine-hydrolysing)
MSERLALRGPDAQDVWVDTDARIFMGHRRLAVIDVSPGGAQPMRSADGRWVICYNGELYNTAEIASELAAKGVRLRGSSDTEVLVEGVAHWGLTDTLSRINGMFAFAVWDRSERQLHLARDRLGIKPLYWGEMNGNFLFASELSAFAEHPAWRPTLDRESVVLYMRYGYVPAPRSIWQQAHKLQPGQYLSYRPGQTVELNRYWSMSNVQSLASREPWRDTPEAAVSALDQLLRDAVKRQMVSDVPFGAFLSGGIDSSLVVALMQAQSERPVTTFSIGFNEPGYNEAQHAKKVAGHLSTDHHELYVEPSHAREVLPKVVGLYDEPFADSSQIPTYLVSALAREQVTVSLSGDGGDECFAGYSRYPAGQQLWQEIDRVPGWLRRGASSALQTLPESTWDVIASALPGAVRPAALGMRVHRLARRIRSSTATEIYASLLSQWHRPEELVIDATEPMSLARDRMLERRIPGMLNRMQYIDTVTYLPDDILTKVDRASMGVSLECRVPLLDHRVVEFAWRIPAAMRQHDGLGKWPLREVLYRYVPRDLVDRPKMGFGVPIDSWLRGSLKEWAWSLLSRAALKRHGVLQAAPIHAAWELHQSGVQDLHYPLWTALMLQDWLDRHSEDAG